MLSSSRYFFLLLFECDIGRLTETKGFICFSQKTLQGLHLGFSTLLHKQLFNLKLNVCCQALKLFFSLLPGPDSLKHSSLFALAQDSWLLWSHLLALEHSPQQFFLNVTSGLPSFRHFFASPAMHGHLSLPTLFLPGDCRPYNENSPLATEYPTKG